MAFTLGSIEISTDRTVVVAEAGANHHGLIDHAEELVRTAARAGADLVKFRTAFCRDGAPEDPTLPQDSFDRDDHLRLVALCREHGAEFLSTPYDRDAADMLEAVGVRGFKIASRDIANLDLIGHVAAKGLPMLLATGASEMDEVHRAVAAVEAAGNREICILHSTMCYPTADDNANLDAIRDLSAAFPDHVAGFSDHTLGTLVPAAAVLMGARVIEKHYTFDKTLPHGPGHWLAADEADLRDLIANIRTLEKARGGGGKRVLECERAAREQLRR